MLQEHKSELEQDTEPAALENYHYHYLSWGELPKEKKIQHAGLSNKVNTQTLEGNPTGKKEKGWHFAFPHLQ